MDQNTVIRMTVTQMMILIAHLLFSCENTQMYIIQSEVVMSCVGLIDLRFEVLKDETDGLELGRAKSWPAWHEDHVIIAKSFINKYI